MIHPYHVKLARVLDRMGGLYTVQDVLGLIAAGKMQSFVEKNSWAITQIAVFPRAKMLEIIIAVGDLKDLRALHDRILEFAAREDIGLVQAYGRTGWRDDARRRGWKVKARSYLYQMEL